MAAALILIMLSASSCGLADPSAVSSQLKIYQKQVEIVHNMLVAEKCPDPYSTTTSKRAVVSFTEAGDLHVEVQKKLYQWLVDKLVECRKSKSALVPEECKNATHLTEAWRQDHNNSDIKPTINNHNQYWYQCDTEEMMAANRPWFRFSGSAGNKLADWCIPHDSCGTSVALWSDDPMPSEIGVVQPIQVYGEYEGNCRNWALNVSVVRCSSAVADFVYRYDDDYGCFLGFCGMSA